MIDENRAKNLYPIRYKRAGFAKNYTSSGIIQETEK